MSTSPTILPSDFPLPSSPSLKQHEPLLPASVSSRIPLRYREKLATIPRNAWLIIGFLITLNIVVWVVVIIVLVSLDVKSLLPTAALAYSLGLRHALDADHISAIDVTTRRLISDGQRPATVGTFFSLGHSTIVIITSLVVAATSNSISNKFDDYSRVGGIIGTSISSAFLLILGAFNTWTLIQLGKGIRKYVKGQQLKQKELSGPIARVCRGLFRLIDRPWKIYPLGCVFGLGFDTSSEIALLGIASIQAAKGTSIWLILVFPILFTVGMCLIDTIDGALMMSLYSMHTSPLPYLYYSGILTAMTSVIALVIGVIQLLSLVQNVADPQGPFWDGVTKAGDSFDIIGGAICGGFLVISIISVIFYKRFSKWADEKRQVSVLALLLPHSMFVLHKRKEISQEK